MRAAFAAAAATTAAIIGVSAPVFAAGPAASAPDAQITQYQMVLGAKDFELEQYKAALVHMRSALTSAQQAQRKAEDDAKSAKVTADKRVTEAVAKAHQEDEAKVLAAKVKAAEAHHTPAPMPARQK